MDIFLNFSLDFLLKILQVQISVYQQKTSYFTICLFLFFSLFYRIISIKYKGQEIRSIKYYLYNSINFNHLMDYFNFGFIL